MIYFKDEEFIRGDCPMTKEEVRIVSVAKLQLIENYRVLDVGAGTGSVSIQICKICSQGEVVAIEKDEEALRVIVENKDKFQAHNLKIVSGEAMNVIPSMDDNFDAIFIGGSGGSIEDIIKACHEKLKYSRTMVLNFITLDNLYKAMQTLKGLNYEVECIQLAVSKAKGKSGMLMGSNPIFIVSALKK